MVPRVQHEIFDGVECKRCSKCREWLSLESFGKAAGRWDGLQHNCRGCSSRYTAASYAENAEARREYHRRYAIENRERLTAKRRAWRKANPERDEETRQRYLACNAEKVREQTKAKYWDNREARLAANKRYYEANSERYVEAVRQWRLANPEDAAAKGIRDRAKRRARERSLPVEPWTEQQLIERDGLVCWLNGCAVGGRRPDGARDWAVDHLIPISADYPDHPGDTLPNLAIACETCNKRKAARLLPTAVARYESNLALIRAA